MDEDGLLSDNDLLIYNEWNNWLEWPEGKIRRLNNTVDEPDSPGLNDVDFIEVIHDPPFLFICGI